MLQILLPLKVLSALLDAIPVTWLLAGLCVAGVLQTGIVPGLHVDFIGMLLGALAGGVNWLVGLAEGLWHWFLNTVAGAVSPI
jgi:hypothetical protein